MIEGMNENPGMNSLFQVPVKLLDFNSARRASRTWAPWVVLGVLVAGAAAPPARAQVTPVVAYPIPENVVTLSAGASLEVPRDWITVVMSTAREGPDAGGVQSQLKQALDAALTEARRVAQPGQVEVRTGGFSLFPRHAPPQPRAGGVAAPGGIVGWQGSTELVIEGRDLAAIAQLTGRIGTLSIARVGTSLSREAREKVEADVTASAIERFRARAADITRQFGFGGYRLREVSVSSAEEGGGSPPMMRAQAMRAGGMAEDVLPVEAGKATVNIQVNGSVQMLR